jgi:hypothetical protein
LLFCLYAEGQRRERFSLVRHDAKLPQDPALGLGRDNPKRKLSSLQWGMTQLLLQPEGLA